eukprot:1157854-Pelagomonas_calceolata.AAC.5
MAHPFVERNSSLHATHLITVVPGHSYAIIFNNFVPNSHEHHGQNGCILAYALFSKLASFVNKARCQNTWGPGSEHLME